MSHTTAYITTAAFAVTFSILAPPAATAAVISMEITATVEFVDDYTNLLGGSVAPGDIVRGIYTYDSDIIDSNITDSIVGDYWHTSSPYGISLNVNGLTFRTNPDNVSFLVELVNDYYSYKTDNYLLRSYNNLFDVSAPSGHFYGADNHISWQLDDPTATALSNTSLPTTPPVLSAWQSIFGLDISSRGGDYFHQEFLIRSHVTSVSLIPTSVPEPTFGLLAFGGMAAIAIRRRKGASA